MAQQSAYFPLASTLSECEAKRVKARLTGVPGVLSAAVCDGHDAVSVDYDSTGIQPEAIESILHDERLL